ncbi:hypothetical protein BN132_4257 [Cronobacter turicensis 564]|nr:hypothetical protein BN132_4257 [Cronobacter turicensis 564]
MHGVHHAVHHFAAALRGIRCAQRQLRRLTGVLGVLLHGRGQLFHAGGRLLQRRGLLFGTRREIGIARGDFAGAAVDGIGAFTHAAHRLDQRLLHVLNACRKLCNLVTAGDRNGFGQVAARNLANVMDNARQRRQQNVADAVPHQRDNQHHQHGQNGGLPLGQTEIAAAFIPGLLRQAHVHVVITGDGFFQRVLFALGRLREVGVHVAGFQVLHQFAQRLVVVAIALLDVACGGVDFRHIHFYAFKRAEMGIRFSQHFFRRVEQIGFRAALLVAGVHHHARRRTA